MNQKQDNLIVALDIGSAWTRVLAADINDWYGMDPKKAGDLYIADQPKK